MAYTAPGQKVRAILLDAKTVDETLGVPFASSGYPYVTFYIQGNGVTSSGVVTLETASYEKDSHYEGVWSPLTTVNASDVTGDQQKAIILAVGNLGYVRPRISTVIGGGGSISVFVEAA